MSSQIKNKMLPFQFMSHFIFISRVSQTVDTLLRNGGSSWKKVEGHWKGGKAWSSSMGKLRFNSLLYCLIELVSNFCFFATPRGTQDLLLALHSGISSDRVQGTIWGTSDWTWLAPCKANSLPTVCIISPAPDLALLPLLSCLISKEILRSSWSLWH